MEFGGSHYFFDRKFGWWWKLKTRHWDAFKLVNLYNLKRFRNNFCRCITIWHVLHHLSWCEQAEARWSPAKGFQQLRACAQHSSSTLKGMRTATHTYGSVFKMSLSLAADVLHEGHNTSNLVLRLNLHYHSLKSYFTNASTTRLGHRRLWIRIIMNIYWAYRQWIPYLRGTTTSVRAMQALTVYVHTSWVSYV